MNQRITTPADDALATLSERLADLAPTTDLDRSWPAEQLRLMGEQGVFAWFLGTDHGGEAWDEEAVTRGYFALAEGCLTTTFVLTQRVGACRRIAGGENEALKAELLPALISGETFATVGISHLTTSRRHLGRPALAAVRAEGGWILNGLAPWVTGADRAQTVVIGATILEGEEVTDQELLVALPMDLPGVATPDPFAMVALTASHTGPITLDEVFVPDDRVVAGPCEAILKKGTAGRPGGPQTSALATGAAAASLALLAREASRREDLVAAYDALAEEHHALREDVLAAARGTPTCEAGDLRQRANSHVLRASQAALTATKGAGYLADAPASRFCRESLFFLVWSCPQPVQNANLCELAGIA